VRNGETSIHRSLQGSEYLIAGGGSSQACIQVAGESSRLSINALHIKLVTGDLHLAIIHLVKAKLVQQLEASTIVQLEPVPAPTYQLSRIKFIQVTKNCLRTHLLDQIIKVFGITRNFPAGVLSLLELHHAG